MALTLSNLQTLPAILNRYERVMFLLPNGKLLLGSPGAYGDTIEFRMARDGYIYNKQEFHDFFGGSKQWDHASKVSFMEKHKELHRRIIKGAANVRKCVVLSLTVPSEVQSQIMTFLFDDIDCGPTG